MTANDRHSRLDRYKNLIVTGGSSDRRPHLPSRYERLAEAMGGALVNCNEGTYCLVRKVYSFGEPFGDMILAEKDALVTFPHSAFSSEDQAGTFRPSELLFFDIETTGLGGAGAVPFLIGCGSLVDEGFEVRQYLLPDYSDEAGMLEAVMAELHGKTVVSYNGVAFDLTMIRDRMIVNRVAREIKLSGHLDLLHSTRRLFRRRLRDCTLTNIERQLLGYYRHDDIPGYLIPSVYFSWLSDESLDSMESVMEHNRLDIFALYFLLELIAEVFESDGANLIEIDDLHSLSRVYGRRKMTDKVLEITTRLDTEAVGDLADDILLYQSMILKRTGDLDRAVRIWDKLSSSVSREGYLANLELAKFFEHRKKDFSQALEYTRQAAERCPNGITHQEALQKRLARLQARLSIAG